MEIKMRNLLQEVCFRRQVLWPPIFLLECSMLPSIYFNRYTLAKLATSCLISVVSMILRKRAGRGNYRRSWSDLSSGSYTPLYRKLGRTDIANKKVLRNCVPNIHVTFDVAPLAADSPEVSLYTLIYIPTTTSQARVRIPFWNSSYPPQTVHGCGARTRDSSTFTGLINDM